MRKSLCVIVVIVAGVMVGAGCVSVVTVVGCASVTGCKPLWHGEEGPSVPATTVEEEPKLSSGTKDATAHTVNVDGRNQNPNLVD